MKSFKDLCEAESAEQAYKRLSKSIATRMKKIQSRIKKHAAEQKKEPKNWGFVGDLGRWDEVLSEISDPE